MSENSLIEIVEENLIYGDFLLSDGRKSRFFIDMYGVICDRQFVNALSSFITNEELAKEVVGIASFNWSPPSIVIGRLIAHEFKKELSIFMIDRHLQVKDRINRIQPRGYVPKKNEKILIVSDIFVTGKAHIKISKELKEKEVMPLNFSVVDRSEDGNEGVNNQIKDLNLVAAVKWEEVKLPSLDTEGDCLDMDVINKQGQRLKKGRFDI